jgi:seryl-tRNA(Sec) selenium transferase
MGKALGGASGGYLTGRKEIIELLRYFWIYILDKKQGLIYFPIQLLPQSLEQP